MQAVVTTSITINEAPEAVFKYLSDLHYHYLWNPQMRKVSPLKKLKLGMEYKTESQVLGTTIEAKNTVTSFVPSKEIALENAIGPVHYQAVFRLYPQDGKTSVKLTVSLTADNKIWVFTVPVLKQLAKRELHTDLQALKIAVENHMS